jgi:hypothetical protein
MKKQRTIGLKVKPVSDDQKIVSRSEGERAEKLQKTTSS